MEELGYDACLSVGYTIDIDNIPDQYCAADDGYIFQGKEFDDLGDFLDAIAQVAGGFHGVYGSINDDSAEDQFHRIELVIPQELGDYTRADFIWLAGQLEAVQQIGRQLEKLGFSVNSPTAAAFLVIDD